MKFRTRGRDHKARELQAGQRSGWRLFRLPGAQRTAGRFEHLVSPERALRIGGSEPCSEFRIAAFEFLEEGFSADLVAPRLHARTDFGRHRRNIGETVR